MGQVRAVIGWERTDMGQERADIYARRGLI